MPNETLSLRDIHLPSGITWWPPALGWWLLVAMIVVAIAIVYFVRRHKQRCQLRDSALASLAKIQQDYQRHQDEKQFVEALSVLLRRICLSCFPRVDVAGLTGSQWLEFLDKHLDDSAQHRFSHNEGRVLISAPYQQQAEIDVDALLSLCKDWIMALPYNEKKIFGIK